MANASHGFSLKRDFLASLVVFLFALPLCMGIALSCGVPPARGLLAGIIGGIVVGTLAGCKLQVSGPAAGLTVVVLDLVQTHGLELLGAVVAIAGIIQLGCALIGLGRWFAMVPPPVVHGMMSGIGAIIMMSQLHIMMDMHPAGSTFQNMSALPGAFKRVFTEPDGQHLTALLAGVATIGIMLVWRARKLQIRWHLPEALPAIGIVTVAAVAFALPINRIDVPSSLAQMLSPLSLSGAYDALTLSLLASALTLALVASAETMLSTASVDKLHNGERSNYNRELAAQGAGNVTSGLLGGLPITGVIVRSKANVEAGATSRWSAVLHGVWLVLAVAALPAVLELIPIASLAALLVLTGWRLLDWQYAGALWKEDKLDLLIFLTTAFMVVATSLLIGVGVGLALALTKARFLRK